MRITSLFGAAFALFLFGMDMMTDALKVIAGSGLKSLLARLTTNPFKGVLAGTVVTAVIQSSSVTTVLVVGFITAGLMTLEQSIGVILGADIGTTITAQIVAFKVTKYALVLVSVGFAMLFISRKKRVQQYGYSIMGLGLIFFGMEMMGDATKPLRTYQPFLDLVAGPDSYKKLPNLIHQVYDPGQKGMEIGLSEAIGSRFFSHAAPGFHMVRA